MKKVTGIGGVFFKAKNPEQLNEWYQKNLGLNTTPYGATFEWYQEPNSEKKALTIWTPFKESSTYFEPSTKDFMINYRVDNLEALVEQLKENGITPHRRHTNLRLWKVCTHPRPRRKQY